MQATTSLPSRITFGRRTKRIQAGLGKNRFCKECWLTFRHQVSFIYAFAQMDCNTFLFNQMFQYVFSMFQYVSIGFMMLGKKWIPMASQPDDQMPSQASRFRWRAWVSAMALQILRLAKKSENLDDIGSFHTENDKVVGCCGGCL